MGKAQNDMSDKKAIIDLEEAIKRPQVWPNPKAVNEGI